MGLYLMILGIQDYRTRGSYDLHANNWTTSVWCIIAGCLALSSSEVKYSIGEIIFTFKFFKTMILIVCTQEKENTLLREILYSGLLSESHPRIFQTITLSFFIAF